VRIFRNKSFNVNRIFFKIKLVDIDASGGLCDFGMYGSLWQS